MKAESERTFVTPDGLLRLIVRTAEGGLTVGFHGFPWHTHSAVLAAARADKPEAAVELWIHDLIAGNRIIAIATVRGVVQDVWVTDDPGKERRFSAADETIEFRLWDGTRCQV